MPIGGVFLIPFAEELLVMGVCKLKASFKALLLLTRDHR